jgi:antitoxin component YwqK of YwqJK toxin-antitoxin module
LYKEYDTLGKLAILREYNNDTLIGYTYFFKPNGDTLKYYKIKNGEVNFPYKKWLSEKTTLLGDYLLRNKKKILWTWYKNGVKTKTLISTPTNSGFIAPE